MSDRKLDAHIASIEMDDAIRDEAERRGIDPDAEDFDPDQFLEDWREECFEPPDPYENAPGDYGRYV